jgi:hypothetical protein
MPVPLPSALPPVLLLGAARSSGWQLKPSGQQAPAVGPDAPPARRGAARCRAWGPSAGATACTAIATWGMECGGIRRLGLQLGRGGLSVLPHPGKSPPPRTAAAACGHLASAAPQHGRDREALPRRRRGLAAAGAGAGGVCLAGEAGRAAAARAGRGGLEAGRARLKHDGAARKQERRGLAAAGQGCRGERAQAGWRWRPRLRRGHAHAPGAQLGWPWCVACCSRSSASWLRPARPPTSRHR